MESFAETSRRVFLGQVSRVAAVSAVGVCAARAFGQASGESGGGCSASATESEVNFTCQNRKILRYPYKGVPFKPYASELYTPSGTQILRDAPLDHLHHHGLMYALGVDGVSFWEETPKGGKQEHESLELPEPGPGGVADMIERLVWRKPDGEAVLNEMRGITVWDTAGSGPSLLSWREQLKPAGGADRELTGSHYYGLGMRFVEAMDDGGRFLNAARAEGEIVRGDERNFPARWCAYQASTGGKEVTVAMFDHPGNPREATWFTMGDASPAFAYLSATLNLHKQPLRLGPEGVALRYGIALWDGHADWDAVDAQCAAWLRLEQGKSALFPA